MTEEFIKKNFFNISLIGESNVGKTNLISVHLKKEFKSNNLTTIGLEKHFEKIKFDKVEYTFRIFDTAGQEKYESQSAQSIHLSDGFLLIFAVDNKASFEKLNKWVNFIDDVEDISKKKAIVVGNKIDVEERVVSNEEALEFAKSNNMKYIESSAKSGYNVDKIFNEIYNEVYSNYKKEYDKYIGIKNKSKKNNEDIPSKASRRKVITLSRDVLDIEGNEDDKKKNGKCCK